MNENEQTDKLLIDGDIEKTLTHYVANVNHEVRQDFPRVLLLLLKQQNSDEILTNMHLYISAILVSSEDKLPIVRQSLVEQIPYIFLFCREHECFNFGYYFYVHLVQIILQCLRDNNIEVRREAYSTLQNMLLGECLINKKQIEDQICPIILQQSPADFPEAQMEFVLKAITIMSRIVPIIGPKKTEEFFLNNFIELCSCKRNNVRKACAAIFPIMCHVLGQNITETKLLEPFTELCDDIFWGVRKTSAEAIPLIALVCSKECRRTKLASIVLELTEDISKWVVTSTFKILGEFISTFAEPCITGLAYTYNRDLKIINPTDPDFSELSDSILMDNYVYYVNKFHESSLENVSQQQQSQNLTSFNSFSTATSNSTITTKSVNTVRTDVSSSLTAHDIANNILENKDKLIKQINGDFKQQISQKSTEWFNSMPSSSSTTTFTAPNEFAENVDDVNFSKSTEWFNSMPSSSSTTTFTAPNEFAKNVDDVNFSKSTEWFNSMPSSSSLSASSPLSSSSSSPSLSTTTTPTIKGRQCRLRNIFHHENALLDLPSIIRSAMDLQIPTIQQQQQQQQQQQFNVVVNNTSMLENDNNGSITASIESAPSSFIWNEFENFCDNHEYIKKNSIENKIEMNESENNINNHKSTIIESPSTKNNDYSNCNKDDTSNNNNNNYNEYSTTTTNYFDISHKNIENNNCNDYDDTDNNDKNMKNHSNLTISTTTITPKTANLIYDDNKLDNDNLDSDDPFNNFNSYKFWHIEPEKLSIIDDNDLCRIEERNKKQLKNTRSDLNNINRNFMDDKPKLKFVEKLEQKRVKMSETLLKVFEKQNIVPPNILKTYVTMVLELNEEEINLNCAYSFPAVALTIGKKNWNLIKPVMQYLCDELDWKVRKTIAASIDILAGILGRDITTNDLVPIYLGFFKDLDEVKIEAIRNFANFLKMVDLTRHDEILSNVGICLRVDSTMNWRIKEDLAKQILPLIEMYKRINKQDSLLYLTSLVGVFLEDKISCVREIAANALAAIVRISDEIHQKAIIEIFIVQEFALSSKWRKRQTFLNILYKLVTYADQKVINLFRAIIDHIERLSNDSVPNIRILVAKIIVQLVKIRGNVLQSKSSDDIAIVNILKRLREDNDRDVREITYSVLIDEEKCLSSDDKDKNQMMDGKLLENDKKINATFHLNNSEDSINQQKHESKDSENENWDHETSFCVADHDHDQEPKLISSVSIYETSPPPVNEMAPATTATTETSKNLRT